MHVWKQIPLPPFFPLYCRMIEKSMTSIASVWGQVGTTPPPPIGMKGKYTQAGMDQAGVGNVNTLFTFHTMVQKQQFISNNLICSFLWEDADRTPYMSGGSRFLRPLGHTTSYKKKSWIWQCLHYFRLSVGSTDYCTKKVFDITALEPLREPLK